jgi:hypothetical protein
MICSAANASSGSGSIDDHVASDRVRWFARAGKRDLIMMGISFDDVAPDPLS